MSKAIPKSSVLRVSPKELVIYYFQILIVYLFEGLSFQSNSQQLNPILLPTELSL